MNEDICPCLTVDTWEEELVIGKKIKRDKYKGKDVIKKVQEKKFIGDIISRNGTNKANIKQRTNKTHGNVNKFVTTVNEIPYERHLFKAVNLMKESILLGGLLTNVEGLINIVKKDTDDLEKPDTILLKQILSTTGNICKVFMQLEMGVMPIKFVIMQKRMNFLNYTLNEKMDSMIRQVYNALKEDSRKGDFVSMSGND